jgi:hypothetical protein
MGFFLTVGDYWMSTTAWVKRHREPTLDDEYAKTDPVH